MFGDTAGNATAFNNRSALQNRENSMSNANEKMARMAAEAAGYLNVKERNERGEATDEELARAEASMKSQDQYAFQFGQ